MKRFFIQGFACNAIQAGNSGDEDRARKANGGGGGVVPIASATLGEKMSKMFDREFWSRD